LLSSTSHIPDDAAGIIEDLESSHRGKDDSAGSLVSKNLLSLDFSNQTSFSSGGGYNNNNGSSSGIDSSSGGSFNHIFGSQDVLAAATTALLLSSIAQQQQQEQLVDYFDKRRKKTLELDGGYTLREIFDPDQDKSCAQALQLYSDSFFPPAEPPVRQIQQLTSTHFYRVIVMQNENSEVIAAAFVVELHEHACYHIDYLCVRSDCRGNGVGGKFFKSLSNYFRSEQRYPIITLESETKMVGWYIKQQCFNLNVQSDQIQEDDGEIRRWWLLFVPLGNLIPPSPSTSDTETDSDSDSDRNQLTCSSSRKIIRSPSYYIYSDNGDIVSELNHHSLSKIIKGIKGLLLCVSALVNSN